MRNKSSKRRQQNQAAKKARKNAKRKAKQAARNSATRPQRDRSTAASPRCEVDTAILHTIIEKAQLSSEERTLLTKAIDTLSVLTIELAKSKTSIRRLKQLLFGSATESTRNVLASLERSPQHPRDTAAHDRPPSQSNMTGEGKDSSENPNTTGEGKTSEGKESSQKPTRKGHGRLPASAYTHAKQVAVSHGALQSGDPCPHCKDNPSPKLRTGKVFLLDPARLLRVRGVSPLEATVYSLERYRCHLCGEVFKASPPPGVGDKKYDESATSLIALLKYGCGLPFHRLEKLGNELGIPLPASTQWDVLSRAVDSLEPVWHELIRQAADGEVVPIDDTNMTVLSLLEEINQERRSKKKTKNRARTGMFTTGVLSKTGGRRLAVFFTGGKHAGENLNKVLAQRQTKDPPILMCDALSRNSSGDYQVILAHCLVHARRNFVDVAANFPDEVEKVLLVFRDIYQHEAEIRRAGLSAEERLESHRAYSLPLLEDLRGWLKKLVEEKLVEPNSGLGKAIRYFDKHWTALTKFCEVAGAPLDNNACERALKRIIVHRKNSLFYKTENGARTGDLFLSLIQSAELNGEPAFEYLTALQRNARDVAERPECWLPWCYRERLAALGGTAWGGTAVA